MLETQIDAHHHFWRYRPEDYPWIDDRLGMLRRDFLPEDLQAAISETGITGVISVQARHSMDETWALLKWASEREWILGVVGWAPLAGPDFERLLPTFAEYPKLRGLRHIVQDEADDNFILRDDFNQGVAALKPWQLVYDILIFERHLPQSIQFVDRHPDQVFVLDHIAKPKIRDRELSPWRENIRELARRPNAYCKLSGVVTEASWDTWTAEDLEPYFDTVLECFGPRRLMFGSDWPVCLAAATYRRWYDVVAQTVSKLSAHEQERFWCGTAKEAYRL